MQHALVVILRVGVGSSYKQVFLLQLEKLPLLKKCRTHHSSSDEMIIADKYLGPTLTRHYCPGKLYKKCTRE